MTQTDAATPSPMFLATIGSFGGNAYTAASVLSDPDQPEILASARRTMNEVEPVIKGEAPILSSRSRGPGPSR